MGSKRAPSLGEFSPPVGEREKTSGSWVLEQGMVWFELV